MAEPGREKGQLLAPQSPPRTDPDTGEPGRQPGLLFFSGGTALRETAHELGCRTANCIHLITPFDSGGSSATLRRAFNMPAVGDLRARMTALADNRHPGNPEIYTLFSYRLSDGAPDQDLRNELEQLQNGSHHLMAQIPQPMQGIIREHLCTFAAVMPPDFPLAGANIGNLVLSAGYLVHERKLAQVAALYSRMLRVRGIVRTVVDCVAHLAVRLASGEVLVGQHRFTGKGGTGVTSPIKDIWLTASEDSDEPVSVSIDRRTESLILGADAICYPVGSFYSSVAANLLPRGVGRAVAASSCPKIFVPNLGVDPELAGHTLAMQVEKLFSLLQEDAPDAKPADLISIVLVDENLGVYPGGLPRKLLKNLGIELVSMPLVRRDRPPLADARLLAEAFLRVSGFGLEH